MTTQQFSPPHRAIPAEEWGPGYELWNAISRWLSQRGPDGTTSVVRVASHLVIVAVAVAVLSVSRIHLPDWQILQAPGSTPRVEDAAPPLPVANVRAAPAANLVRAPVPITLIPERPQQVDLRQHTVQAGDTLYDIAEKYHISADTLVWANNLEENPDLLRLGQQLTILPVDGVLYTIVAGDTLESIAKKYSAKPADILSYEWNRLDRENPVLTAGERLIVPAGVKPEPPAKPKPAAPAYQSAQSAKAPANAPVGGGKLVWPVAGTISQGYARYHPGIDLASWTGNPVKAADAGYVAVAGWSNVGYGNYIIVDHGNGYQTLYAHLSRIDVKAGASVARGQVIGAVGSTGNSTGPHLHFEVRLRGAGQNPFNFLP